MAPIDSITGVLPGGYRDERGILHREVEVRPLSGREEELLADGRGQAGDALAAAVLSRCTTRLGEAGPLTEEIVRILTVADRRYLFLKLREATFGSRIEGTVLCPWSDCGARVDIDFFVKDIEQALEEAPQDDLTMDTQCPECSRELSIPFDVQDFFFGELRINRDLLYHEVHCLAYHYHWSEQEIMGMSMGKRRRYVNVLMEELNGSTVGVHSGDNRFWEEEAKNVRPGEKQRDDTVLHVAGQGSYEPASQGKPGVATDGETVLSPKRQPIGHGVSDVARPGTGPADGPGGADPGMDAVNADTVLQLHGFSHLTFATMQKVGVSTEDRAGQQSQDPAVSAKSGWPTPVSDPDRGKAAPPAVWKWQEGATLAEKAMTHSDETLLSRRMALFEAIRSQGRVSIADVRPLPDQGHLTAGNREGSMESHESPPAVSGPIRPQPQQGGFEMKPGGGIRPRLHARESFAGEATHRETPFVHEADPVPGFSSVPGADVLNQNRRIVPDRTTLWTALQDEGGGETVPAGEVKFLPAAPAPPRVIIVPSRRGRNRLSYAFWERSYLAHFRLRPLR